MKTNLLKALSMFLAIVLPFSCGAAAFAEQTDEADTHLEQAVDSVAGSPDQNGALSVDEACMLGSGYHDQKDYAKAYSFFLQAAEQGDALGCAWVGFYYENGYAVETSEEEACRWYEKAAALGNAYAANARGQIAKRHDDYAAALPFFTQAADAGNDDARATLGWMYFNGRGAERDYQKSRDYYLLSAQSGNAESMHRLGELYESYFPDVDFPERIAMSWYEQSALLGNAASMYHMGVFCEQGKGVTKDLARAEEWYLKAIEGGNERAPETLFKLYGGDGELHDQEKADAMFAKVQAIYQAGMDRGESDAFYKMAKLYMTDTAYRDLAKALAHFEQAAELGSGESLVYDNIGHLYTNYADVIPLDYEKAATAFQKAIELGSGYAMYCTGLMYQNGEYFEKDPLKAEECFEEARKMGYQVP